MERTSRPSAPPPADPDPALGHEDAIAWLRRVGGELYRTGPGPNGRKAWLAVVRAPRPGAATPRTIVALGATLVDAAHAAALQWRRLGGDRPLLH